MLRYEQYDQWENSRGVKIYARRTVNSLPGEELVLFHVGEYGNPEQMRSISMEKNGEIDLFNTINSYKMAEIVDIPLGDNLYYKITVVNWKLHAQICDPPIIEDENDEPLEIHNINFLLFNNYIEPSKGG